MRVRRGNDLDPVAALEFGAQRHKFVVDLGRDAAVADVAVDRVGEVHRCRASGERKDLAFGREYIDLVGEEVDLDVLEELGCIAARVLNVQQRLQPLVRAALQLAQLGLGRFVEPVRGNTRLGDPVHRQGADLHLHRSAIGADQRGVQRLVAVDLRDRDVILELAGHRFVQPVQHA